MESRKFEIIKQLMEELQEEMQYSEDDLGSRLGRAKPEALSVEIETEEPMDGDDLAMEGEELDPEQKLKERLLKLRG